jgi:hypothetical protein
MDRGTRLMLGMLTIAVCMLTAKFVFESEPEAQANYAMAGDPEPTIVWYDIQLVSTDDYRTTSMLYRAWSDGTIEIRKRYIYHNDACSIGDTLGSCTPWTVISEPDEGLAAMSDINGDEVVDVLDLLTVIERWGPAPHNIIPLSDCPLAMINP